MRHPAPTRNFFSKPYLSREAQLFVGWVSGSVTHAGVGFHASTQPTFILYLIPPTHDFFKEIFFFSVSPFGLHCQLRIISIYLSDHNSETVQKPLTEADSSAVLTLWLRQ
ncbi:MAG: hypothetical protein EWV40_05675 [Microcystis flos-aquae Mf_WU_F_19750830_S460]|uniref:Uncharacterized protein n=1 Tax=Microcystis flos-aquae Mf_WU_F_19750830_S460 TaxID=2486237 RepID=A0A552LXS6_9CHRO|nr:MAG: hypothetical protein EWV40_05675 [Microcystis flos-aquae Mf_WU_F_19750830_S460]